MKSTLKREHISASTYGAVLTLSGSISWPCCRQLSLQSLISLPLVPAQTCLRHQWSLEAHIWRLLVQNRGELVQVQIVWRQWLFSRLCHPSTSLLVCTEERYANTHEVGQPTTGCQSTSSGHTPAVSEYLCCTYIPQPHPHIPNLLFTITANCETQLSWMTYIWYTYMQCVIIRFHTQLYRLIQY